MSRRGSMQQVGSGADWNPKKNEDGTDRVFDPKNPPAIEGWYLGGVPNQGKDGNSTLHSMLCSHVDGTDHPKGKEVSINFWGSHVLDDQLSKIRPGVFAAIEYEGVKQPTTKGGRSYNSYKVFKDEKDFRPELVGGAPVAPAQAPAQNVAAAPVAQAPSPSAAAPVANVIPDDTDDLPF